MKRYLLLTFLLILVVSLSACNFSLAADVTPPPGYQPPPPVTQEPVNGPLYPLVAPDARQGAGIYTEKCAPCHGEAGMGDGPRSTQLSNPVAPLGSPEFARQASSFHAQWQKTGNQGELSALPKADHYLGIHGFEDPRSPLCQWLAHALGCGLSQ